MLPTMFSEIRYTELFPKTITADNYLCFVEYIDYVYKAYQRNKQKYLPLQLLIYQVFFIYTCVISINSDNKRLSCTQLLRIILSLCKTVKCLITDFNFRNQCNTTAKKDSHCKRDTILLTIKCQSPIYSIRLL